MVTSIDPERYAVATQRFTAFFTELGKIYMEREDVLAQVALALLAREHVLMTGPPGTAKSQIATAVLGRIVDATTGKPSVYARQFTENTVQTDLVGPINFKTLMDTGRTEHFTDEGMLGAVHAFLDEVFDGRDMLLRSALNVLNERELKEGTRTTRGLIECAIMTSNRYLAEVLEGSRETLLAFVDRVGFVSFVPRSFSDPANLSRVLARQVGGVRTPPLTGVLTIQDLDVLQAVADSVTVSEPVCEALVALLGMLEEEMAAASKADPEFVATRYLSVRTAVRAARILKAICVYDKIFRDTSRPLEAVQADFLGLRLHLLLAGPQPEAVARLILREADPRERRQLAIVRTEREIFDRCLRRLPPAASRPPPVPAKKRAEGRPDLAKIRKALAAGTAFTDPTELFEAARSLATESEENSERSEETGALLREVVERLHERSLRAGLTAGGLGERPPGDVVLELGAMAEQLEAMYGGSRPVARWLRGRAIALIDDAATLAPSSPAKVIERLLESTVDVDMVATQAEIRIGDVEALANIRERLRAQGADPAGDEPGARWKPAVARLENDVV
ncbi:MAG: AAA family ATPase, partial [Deltaproteobacteria bacterium]